MHSTAFLCVSICLLVNLCSASPFQIQQRAVIITPATILASVSDSASCVGAPYPAECRTATQAVQPIANSFEKYNVTSAGEMAALISLMGFESAGFKYQNNYYPGNPGQGTRNMQSATYNRKYAESLSLNVGSVPASSQTPAELNHDRALLTSNDDYDFGSAAWFLTSQCSSSVRESLQTGSQAGWAAYVGECIGTLVTPDRLVYWQKAVAALSS